MLQQAVDFRAECDALVKVLEPLSDEDWEREGQFKDWTINEIMQHLHYWNYGADLSLNDEDAFLQLMDKDYSVMFCLFRGSDVLQHLFWNGKDFFGD